VTGAIDVRAALAWRDFQVSDYDDAGQVAWAAGAGIEILRGAGRLAGPHVVAVGGETYAAEHIVLATGSDPVMPAIPGLRELEGVWTSRDATGLTEVPRRLLVLGAGPVGVELAQAIGRLGASVTLVESGDHVLPREPRAVGEAVGEALAADGITLRFGQHATAVRRNGEDYVLELADGTELRGDKLLVATGRRARVDGLGLETVGVDADPQGLPVDARLSLGDGLWAIGDVTGVWPLTYVGKYQGRVVAANILGRGREADYAAVPRVVFTDPQAAAVGEDEGVYTATIPLAGVPRTSTYTRAYDTRPGFLTLVSDGERLTGAHAVGPEAGEWLQQATVAIRARVPLEVLFDVIQPFPTFSEAFLFALRDLEAQTTHRVAKELSA
jgi:pyruvate/2-oxoglutarate dehydrogenase complex dihydrolipoamide dehydrogenase (E3) component